MAWVRTIYRCHKEYRWHTSVDPNHLEHILHGCGCDVADTLRLSRRLAIPFAIVQIRSYFAPLEIFMVIQFSVKISWSIQYSSEKPTSSWRKVRQSGIWFILKKTPTYFKWFGTFLRANGVDLLKIIVVKFSHFIHRLAQLKLANEAGTGHNETAEPISNLQACRFVRIHRDASVSNDNCDEIGLSLPNKRSVVT